RVCRQNRGSPVPNATSCRVERGSPAQSDRTCRQIERVTRSLAAKTVAFGPDLPPFGALMATNPGGSPALPPPLAAIRAGHPLPKGDTLPPTHVRPLQASRNTARPGGASAHLAASRRVLRGFSAKKATPTPN